MQLCQVIFSSFMKPHLLLSHLLSGDVHVPYDNAAVTAAGDELTGVWGIAQTLDSITVRKPHKSKTSRFTPTLGNKKAFLKSNTGRGFFVLLVSLQFDGGSFAAPDVPHDDGVVWAAGEQHPLSWIPAKRSHVAWSRGYVGKTQQPRRWIRKGVQTTRTFQRTWG